MLGVATKAEDLLDAVRRLNPDGSGSVSSRQAADAAGLTISDCDLSDLIRALRETGLIEGHAPVNGGTEWGALRLT